MRDTRQYDSRIHRIIILGHRGFIGSHLMAYCKDKNLSVDVVGFSKPEINLTKLQDVEKVSKSFTSNSAVVMLSCIKPNISDSRDTFFQNISMVGNLCHILQDHPVARFIYMSSAAVYGEDVDNTDISEITPVLPKSYYGMAKYISERLLRKTFDERKRSGLIILRPPVIYGPGERTISYNPAGFLTTTQTGNTITLWGDGSEKREFIYIDDIVKLIHYFIFHPFDGVINIASEVSYTFGEIITMLNKLLGKKITIRTKKRSKEKVDHVYNNQLLQRLVPNFRFTTLPEGLIQTINSKKNYL